MPRRDLSTTSYSAEARQRLADAVKAARVALGFVTRPEFLKAFPNMPSPRSLEMVELGEEGVGAATFHRLAGVLPGWTFETFRQVLDGGPIPTPPTRTPTRLDVQWSATTRVTGEITALLKSQPGAAKVLGDMTNWHRQFKDAGLSGDDLLAATEEALARAKLLQLDSNQQPFG